MSQRSDSRGSPAANSTRLALRTCSMGATRTASLSRCALRCLRRRFARSPLMPSVQPTIPFTWAMARSHVRANTESLHHTQLRPVNSSSQKLMDGEGVAVGLHWLVNYLDYFNTSGYITVMLGVVAYITFTLDVI